MTPAERDDAILKHLKRYHLTTPEVLRRLFFPDVSTNAVTKVTSRLTREGRISRPLRLFEQRRYFVLTPREAVRLGEHRAVARKFEYQGLVNAYGVLCFCATTGTQKFTPKEFEEKFPELVIRGVRSGNYYIDVEETDAGPLPAEGKKSRLGFMLVDYGTSVETLVKKTQKITGRAYTLPAFARLIQKGNFVIGIITPTVAKAEAVKAALSDDSPGNVRYRIEAVPELGELLLHRGRLRQGGKDKRKLAAEIAEALKTSQAPQALSEEGGTP
jgi:hypothetical protein